MNRKDRRAQATGKASSSRPATGPNPASAHFSQANALYGARRFDEALAAYDKAIALRPSFAEAYVNRGSLLNAMGRAAEALASYDAAIAMKYASEVVYYNRAIILLALDRASDALASSDAALAINPRYAEAYNNRGNILERLDRFKDALACYEKAVELKPDYAEAYNNRGNMLLKVDPGSEVEWLQSLRLALQNYDKAVALKPNLAGAHSNRGNVLYEMNRLPEALASFDKAIALAPAVGMTYLRRGTTLIGMGNMAEAETMLGKALASTPGSAEALYYLSYIRKYDNDDIDAMEQALQSPSLSLDDRVRLNFALGKVNDDTGNYEKAFGYYATGNSLRNESVNFDPASIPKLAADTIAIFSRDRIGRGFGHASESVKPLFIVGMPRSGTTLLATMLSNHERIDTAGELSAFRDFARILPEIMGTGQEYPHVVTSIDAALAKRMADAYLQRLTRDAGADATYVIDKQPLNFTYLGLIAMIFPQAHIIHCTRDRLDTGLSCYVQMFTPQAAWSFDLGNIGTFHREYERLMGYWRRVSPLKMIDVSYEDLIDSPSDVVENVLRFLDLEWDPRCVNPQANTSSVLTPSSWQVRQPINRNSVERWRNYERHLGPLKDAMGNMNR